MREHSGTSGIATSSPGITRGSRAGAHKGVKAAFAKALSWADPRTLKKQTKDILSGIKGSDFGAGRVAEDRGGGVPYSPS